MDINFCNSCNNIMFVYSDDSQTKLYLGCKVCGEKTEYTGEKSIYKNNSCLLKFIAFISSHLSTENAITTITFETSRRRRTASDSLFYLPSQEPHFLSLKDPLCRCSVVATEGAPLCVSRMI